MCRAQGAQPVMPEYRPEDMVFEMEEEKIPVYNPPKPADEDDQEDDEAGQNAANGAQECMPERVILCRLPLKRLLVP